MNAEFKIYRFGVGDTDILINAGRSKAKWYKDVRFLNNNSNYYDESQDYNSSMNDIANDNFHLKVDHAQSYQATTSTPNSKPKESTAES